MIISLSKEIFERGGFTMNYPELIWHLIEMLLQKDDVTNQSKTDDVKYNTSNSQNQDEV